jgi:hypothetical protein
MSISRRFSACWAARSLFLPLAKIKNREVRQRSAKSADGFPIGPTIED